MRPGIKKDSNFGLVFSGEQNGRSKGMDSKHCPINKKKQTTNQGFERLFNVLEKIFHAEVVCFQNFEE